MKNFQIVTSDNINVIMDKLERISSDVFIRFNPNQNIYRKIIVTCYFNVEHPLSILMDENPEWEIYLC